MKSQIDYELRRSSRRTLSMEVTRAMTVIVRAPLRASKQDIERFVSSHTDWIARQMEKQAARNQNHPEPDAAEIARLKQAAKDYIPGRVAHWAARMGLAPAGVKITSAKTRFGSCSGKNSLCFSYRLMTYPPEVIDYVVVHELAHIVHKNHGPDFHALVAAHLPDHSARRALLRQ